MTAALLPRHAKLFRFLAGTMMMMLLMLIPRWRFIRRIAVVLSVTAIMTMTATAFRSVRRRLIWNHRLFSTINHFHDNDDDTIFALSTGPMFPTAMAIIRISGPRAHEILDQLTNTTATTATATTSPNHIPTRKAVLRTLRNPNDPTDVLDQALVLKFNAPHSFTGENVVELHTHGSRAVVQGILQVLATLLRVAEKGEFTSRAYANGKLDFLQVEALADLLMSDTSAQRKQALLQLNGTLSQLYTSWRTQLTKGLAHAEAVIDFGEDDLDDDSSQIWGTVLERMELLQQSMQHHLRDGQRGELVRDGLKICIVGPPNAGKSSLFNVLAKRDAAIVSSIAGTTRDVLELNLDLGGVRCTLSDTAGVRDDSVDVIEQEGIHRARKAAEQADIIVAMIDGTDASQGIESLQSILSGESILERTMLVMNKLDLADTPTVNDDIGLSQLPTFQVSCSTLEGLDAFLDSLTDRVVTRVSNPNKEESALITRARHRQHVEAAVEALQRFTALANQGPMAVDMAAEELRLATSELGRITGAVDVEDVLDVLFKDFCIGK